MSNFNKPILFAGPAGSGKSFILYRLQRYLKADIYASHQDLDWFKVLQEAKNENVIIDECTADFLKMLVKVTVVSNFKLILATQCCLSSIPQDVIDNFEVIHLQKFTK